MCLHCEREGSYVHMEGVECACTTRGRACAHGRGGVCVHGDRVGVYGRG